MAGVEFRPSMEMGMTALKTFANPSCDIIKAIPVGPIELALRGTAVVSNSIATQNQQNATNKLEEMLV